MGALVPEDQPGERPHRLALEVPGVVVERVAVAEHDRRIDALAPSVGGIHLDVQLGAVGQHHPARLPGGSQAWRARRRRCGSGRPRCGAPPSPPAAAPATRAAITPAAFNPKDSAISLTSRRRSDPPTACSRGTRGPTRVTISYPMVSVARAQSLALGHPLRGSPKRVSSSPATAADPAPRSTTNWSMQTRPATVHRCPSANTGPTFEAAAGCRRRSRAARVRPPCPPPWCRCGRRTPHSRRELLDEGEPSLERHDRPQVQRGLGAHRRTRRDAVGGDAGAHKVVVGLRQSQGGG